MQSYRDKLNKDEQAWLDAFIAQYVFQRVDGLSQEEKRVAWRRHKSQRRDIYGVIDQAAERDLIRIPADEPRPEGILIIRERKRRAEALVRRQA